MQGLKVGTQIAAAARAGIAPYWVAGCASQLQHKQHSVLSEIDPTLPPLRCTHTARLVSSKVHSSAPIWMMPTRTRASAISRSLSAAGRGGGTRPSFS